MVRLKRWESPRRQGRNHKGKGGSARQRQLKKRTQQWRQRLKSPGDRPGAKGSKRSDPAPLFYGLSEGPWLSVTIGEGKGFL